ncbi:hypothetical protein [Nannocystis bainbridge]|uniref:Uncharacterized protein n=1 Tax=Nannocystis bainbridge TaxID=2995303 RepID=A0ABT5DY56_9BACT|nr:hypothetical protein [Nannocystis bainbridge]MDC0718557.1 hypothetical protein [Nannocystis bainbridge]
MDTFGGSRERELEALAAGAEARAMKQTGRTEPGGGEVTAIGDLAATVRRDTGDELAQPGGELAGESARMTGTLARIDEQGAQGRDGAVGPGGPRPHAGEARWRGGDAGMRR